MNKILENHLSLTIIIVDVCLSTVNNVGNDLDCDVKIWMLVQRKWMYLEGIFIGGDIRAQLPEEAKKFDQIDKAFKRVSSTCTRLPACSFMIDVMKQTEREEKL